MKPIDWIIWAVAIAGVVLVLVAMAVVRHDSTPPAAAAPVTVEAPTDAQTVASHVAMPTGFRSMTPEVQSIFLDRQVQSLAGLTDAQRESLGKEVCRQWKDNPSSDGLLTTVTSLATFSRVGLSDASRFVGASVSTHCPTEWPAIVKAVEELKNHG